MITFPACAMSQKATSGGGGGGTTYASLTITGGGFNTSTPISGSASWNAGSATSSGLVLPSRSFTLEMDLRNAVAGAWSYIDNWIQLTDSGGHRFSLTNHDSWPVPYYNGGGSTRGGGGGPYDDTNVHRLAMVVNDSAGDNNGSQTFWIDGNDTFFYNNGITCVSGAAGLSITLPSNTTLDNIRITDGALYSSNYTPGALVRTGATIVLWTFDNSSARGAGT